MHLQGRTLDLKRSSKYYRLLLLELKESSLFIDYQLFNSLAFQYLVPWRVA